VALRSNDISGFHAQALGSNHSWCDFHGLGNMDMVGYTHDASTNNYCTKNDCMVWGINAKTCPSNAWYYGPGHAWYDRLLTSITCQ